MSKWQKIDPDQIKVGDRVRVKTINQPDAYDFTVFERGATWIGVFLTVNHREWYIRKPRKYKPPTRPDEPPVGSFFRVDRTGELYLRMHEGNGDYGYVSLLGDREGDLCTWTDITDHGDTITRLLLAEATDD